MLGIVRLLLAMAVALSHVNLRIAELNPGVMAVVGFYMISGYVMTGLVRQHFSHAALIPAFYLDRAMRLMPQYLAIVLLTLIWFYSGDHTTAFLQHAPSVSELFSNLLVVPLNYYMLNGSDQFTLIPPAWSLGAEIQFYLIFPFLLLFGLRHLAFAIGGAVLLCASIGVIHPDYFGYRLLPGVLVYFLLGSYLFDLKDRSTMQNRLWMAIVISAIAAATGLSLTGHLGLPYNKEILIGIVFAASAIVLLANKPSHRLDQVCGDLSYGVFLNHFLLQWVFGVPQGATAMMLYTGASLLLSWQTQRWIEQPVLRWRKRLRKAEV